MSVNALRVHSYSGGMSARKAVPTSRAKPAIEPVRTIRERSNRIYELTKRNKTTYGAIAAELGTSETQIGRLASGERRLTQAWMNKLARVLKVAASEIIERNVAEGLRTVRVSGRVQAGSWSESHDWPEEDHYSVMVPDDPAFRGLSLYAREISGESMNTLYPHGSIAVLSNMMQRPGEYIIGKRYHVQVRRSDGSVEETIKTLIRDSKGNYWLKPESESPEFSAISLDPREGEEVVLLGRVRWAVKREE